jgi:hypothetical protein
MIKDIEFSIVGKDTMPTPRYRGHWAPFLREQAPLLKSGQVLRVLVPKEHKPFGLCSVWHKVCVKELHKKARTMQKKQSNGDVKMWLWYED